MEEMNDERIRGVISEMFCHKRNKSRESLEEASDTGKTFTFFSSEAWEDEYLSANRNDNKGGARIPGMTEWSKVLRFKFEFRDEFLKFIQEDGCFFLC